MVEGPSLRLTFLHKTNEDETLPDATNWTLAEFTFTKRPLGLRFPQELPIVVTGFEENSVALAGGVQLGMVLKAVDDQDVLGCTTYEEAFELLTQGIGRLR